MPTGGRDGAAAVKLSCRSLHFFPYHLWEYGRPCEDSACLGSRTLHMNPTRPYPSWACRTAIGPVPVLGGWWRNICVLVAHLWLSVQCLRAIVSQEPCKSSSMSSPTQSSRINSLTLLTEGKTPQPVLTKGLSRGPPATPLESPPSTPY